jgi:cell division septal protein FtsQ|nr:MAG: hypothetical protein DIU57_09025 [Pseudomonadota bacterium]
MNETAPSARSTRTAIGAARFAMRVRSRRPRRPQPRMRAVPLVVTTLVVVGVLGGMLWLMLAFS